MKVKDFINSCGLSSPQFEVYNAFSPKVDLIWSGHKFGTVPEEIGSKIIGLWCYDSARKVFRLYVDGDN